MGVKLKVATASSGVFLTIFVFLLLIPGSVSATAPDNYRWVTHNDGIQAGGRVSGIVIDPNATSTVYFLSNSGGVFKTTNSGAAWSEVSTGLASKYSMWGHIYGNLLTMDPNDSSILYASLNGVIYKTTNGGTSWVEASDGTSVTSRSGSSVTDTIAGIIVDPADSDHLFAATVVSGHDGGVFESNDGATTWTQVAGSSQSGSIGGFGSNSIACNTIITINAKSKRVCKRSLLFEQYETNCIWI